MFSTGQYSFPIVGVSTVTVGGVTKSSKKVYVYGSVIGNEKESPPPHPTSRVNYDDQNCFPPLVPLSVTFK